MEDRPTFIDLFAGCGGISLGVRNAGMRSLLAFEFDAAAARSHGHVHHDGDPLHSTARDVTADPRATLRTAGLDGVRVDVIAGGPPCQAFTRLGRARLASAAGRSDAWLSDPRAQLFRSYLSWVEVLRPRAVLVENVPDCLRQGDRNIAETIAVALRDLGYGVRYTLLNAARYDVPQWRERMFLMAVRSDLGIEPVFPLPTRSAGGEPQGYRAARSVALFGVADDDPFYVPAPESGLVLPAREALEDLPS